MSTNKNHLVKVGEFELDDRMSDETGKFMIGILSSGLLSNLTQNMIESIRKAEFQLDAIDNISFDNLPPNKYTEFKIKNPTDGYEIPVWVFTPTDAPKDAPIVIFYHGGAWVFNTPKGYYHPIGTLASRSKAIWVSVDYRLAPEFKHRVQMTDYLAVVDWVSANRDQLSSSKNSKLGVAGDSAGGQIAAVMAHKNRGLIDFQILVYPCVDNTTHRYPSTDEFDADRYMLLSKAMQFFVEAYVEEPSMATSPDVSPILASDFSNLAKCLVISAEMDILTDAARTYHEKILAAGGSSEYHVVKGTVHGFFSTGLTMKNAFEEGVNLILDFLRRI